MEGKPESPWGALLSVLKRCRTAVGKAWTSHVRAWTKPAWFAGIKPLPRDMASKLFALSIAVVLILVSLVYGDHYQDMLWRGRVAASGEHLPLAETPAETDPSATPAPAPETADASAGETPGPARLRLPQVGEAFIDRFKDPVLSEHWFISDGWSNGDHMDNDWRASQVSVGPTGLVLTLAKAPAGHPTALVGAEVRTEPFYRYGYFEVSMKVPKGAGLVTGIFTYAHIDGKVRPNEIDIEILGRDTRTLEATIHENGKSTHKRVRLPFDSADGFHTFGIEWEPEYVRWYADGQMIFEEDGPAAKRLVRPQQYIFDVWGSTPLKSWVGRIDHSRAPWKLEIACAAYEPAYSGRELCAQD